MTNAARTRILIVAGAIPQQQGALFSKLEQLRDLGTEVVLACNFDTELLPVPGGLATTVMLPSLNGEYPRRFQRALNAATTVRRVWLHAQRNAAVRRYARRADVLVALDQLAIYSVWEFAQRHRRPQAVYGVEPALRAVMRHQRFPDKSASGPLSIVPARSGVAYRGLRQTGLVAAATVVSSTVSPTVMRSSAGALFWTTMVRAPKVPDRIRGRLAYSVHLNLLRADRPELARRASAAAARLIRDPNTRADLLIREALAEAKQGTPATTPDAVKAGLAICDGQLKRKEIRKVALMADRAARLLFDRTLHFDRTTSPLAQDPAGYLAQWRSSETGRLLTAPRGRAGRPPAGLPKGRPLRLTIVVNNDGGVPGESTGAFLGEVRRHYESAPDVEVRFLDFAESAGLSELTAASRQLIDHIVVGQSLFGNKVESQLRPHLDWADTVLVEGCEAAAAMVTMLDPGSTRIVVRMRDAAPLALWSHLTDFSRIDDLVFPSSAVQAFAQLVFPQLADAGAPAQHVIPDLTPARTGVPVRRTPSETTRFTLGVLDADSVARDPRWAVAVLRALHERDRRYRLLLIGEGLDADQRDEVAAYEARLSSEIAELGGCVLRRPVKELPTLLRQVGVVLDGSVRQAFSWSLAEGIAAGAVPVVRDWPMFTSSGITARDVMPPDWVVDTAEQAAERILKVTATPEIWLEAAREAADYAAGAWDAARSAAALDEVVFGASPIKPA